MQGYSSRTETPKELNCRNEVAPHQSVIYVYLKRAGIDMAGSIHVCNNLDHIGWLGWNGHGRSYLGMSSSSFPPPGQEQDGKQGKEETAEQLGGRHMTSEPGTQTL